MNVSEKAATLLGKSILDPELASFLAGYAAPGSRIAPYRKGATMSVRLSEAGIRLDFDGERALQRISFCNPASGATGAFPDIIVNNLNLGAERHEVQAALGPPDSTEASRDHVWDIFYRGPYTLCFEYSRLHDRLRNVSITPTKKRAQLH